jgi:uncharacterized protein (TIGR02611 family)
MGVVDRVSQARQRQILSHARPSLEPDEVVLEWLRIRDPDERRTGFIYLTRRSCVFYWGGYGSHPTSIPLKEIRAWGVDRSSDRGPVLGIETEGLSTFVQLLVTTERMVTKVNSFLDQFARHVPKPRGPLSNSSHPGDYEANTGIKVVKEKKTVGGHTRRLAMTIGGIAILLLGIVLLFVPGPGILVVLLGLSIMAREYDWAQDILHWARDRYRRTTERIKARRAD